MTTPTLDRDFEELLGFIRDSRGFDYTGYKRPTLERRFAITPEECAGAIAHGVERDARTVMVPRMGWILVAFTRLFPRVVESKLAAINQSHVSA